MSLTFWRITCLLEDLSTGMLLRREKCKQVDEYDEYLVGYQQASVATETIAAVLNGGQGFVLAAGLTAVLASATLFSAPGTFTGGDLVSQCRPAICSY